jgi:hypothetical protein
VELLARSHRAARRQDNIWDVMQAGSRYSHGLRGRAGWKRLWPVGSCIFLSFS